MAAPRPAFSVIIPVLDEADTLPETLAHLEAFPEIEEILVVDGGSRDATADLARGRGVRLLRAPRGRGRQLNCGARAARLDHLMFLHADCRLPDEAFDAVRHTFAAGHAAGLFRIDFGSRHPILACLSWLSRCPSRWTQFGEGALFVRRAEFNAIGGFPEWPLMEDVEILRRLRRRHSLAAAPETVQASPRRFLQRGVARQMLRNLLVYSLFHLGVSPERLVRLYNG
jgi:rSAM/selenodomain-associated transferase 2